MIFLNIANPFHLDRCKASIAVGGRMHIVERAHGRCGGLRMDALGGGPTVEPIDRKEPEMKKFDIVTDRGSALAPRFEHATVHDVMRHGVITCGPEASLRDVSRIMASYHVHAVVVALRQDVWGVVTASDVPQAAGTPRERLSAGEIAATEFVTVRPRPRWTRPLSSCASTRSTTSWSASVANP